MANIINRIGKKYGRLTIVSYKEKKSALEKKRAICLCECGNTWEGEEWYLVTGNTKSCGCLRTETNHAKGDGRTHHRLYRVFYAMKGRCEKSSNPEFHNYGGRGISVCAEWSTNFVAFREWAYANGYKTGLTIDRIDTDGNYHPENCRWVSLKTNQNNKRNNIKVTYRGETKTLSEWINELGLSFTTVRYRLERGFDLDDAFSKKKFYRGFINKV